MKRKEHDGMQYPSIDDLLEKVDSKYKLAYISSMRAKKIDEENYVSDYTKCSKPVGQALEEILEGDIKIEFEKVE